MSQQIVTIPQENQLKKKVKRAMSRIVLKQPFFSMILLNQKLQYTDQIPTMGVNGTCIYVNLEFVRNLTPDEVIGVLIHECMHLCWNHITRRGTRDRKLWNYAGDYTINPVIKDEGFTLPIPHLDEDHFHKKTADEIYKILEKEQPEIDPNFIDLDDTGLSQADKKKIEHQAKVTLAKAVQIAGNSAPKAIRKMFDEIMEPSAPWETLLREFMQTALGNDDSTWRRPHRNHIHQNLYLPSTEGHQLPRIACMIDTSGSIYNNKNLFEEFAAEINNIITDLTPEQVDIYYVDTSIQKHDTFEEGEIPKYDLVGGGGTNFTSFFEVVENEQPACIIVFTDMFASGMPTWFDTPILWCVYGNDNPSTDVSGKVIQVK